MFEYGHGFLLLFLVSVDLIEHDLYLILFHRDVLLVAPAELLEHVVLHFEALHLCIEETLLLVQLLLQFLYFVSGNLSGQLQIILVLLLVSVVLPLFIVHLGHEFDELGVVEQTVLGECTCMLDLMLHLLGVVVLLPLELLLQLADLAQVVVALA